MVRYMVTQASMDEYIVEAPNETVALEVVKGHAEEAGIEAHHCYQCAPEVTAVLDEAEGEGEDG